MENPTAAGEHQNILFVSDAHLGGFDTETNKLIESDLTGLFEHATASGMQICILGDLFDYFLHHYGYVPPISPQIIELLGTYASESHNKVIYVTGNHDNWDRGYFAGQGFEVSHEFWRMNFGGRTGILLHGDGLSDPGLRFPRPVFHRTIRDPRFVDAFIAATGPRRANGIMCWFSRTTRALKPVENSHHVRVDDWARSHLERGIDDIVICGHHHKLRFEQADHKLYINLGAFFDQRSCALYTNREFRLVSWQNQSKTFRILARENRALHDE